MVELLIPVCFSSYINATLPVSKAVNWLRVSGSISVRLGGWSISEHNKRVCKSFLVGYIILFPRKGIVIRAPSCASLSKNNRIWGLSCHQQFRNYYSMLSLINYKLHFNYIPECASRSFVLTLCEAFNSSIYYFYSIGIWSYQISNQFRCEIEGILFCKIFASR